MNTFPDNFGPSLPTADHFNTKEISLRFDDSLRRSEKYTILLNLSQIIR